MKKINFLIIPATALFFVACNTEAPAPSQAEIDAQVDAKVKAATEQLKAECDSRIMAAAQLKKDSILVKMGSKPAPVTAAPAPKPAPKAPVKPTKPTPPPPPPPAPAPAPPKPKGGLKGLSDQSKQEQGGGKGLKGLSDQSKAKEEQGTKKGGLKGLSDQSK